jgi:hypothetical protein
MVWSIALYGAEKWTLRKIGKKNLVSFGIRFWRKMEIIWPDHAENKEVLHGFN